MTKIYLAAAYQRKSEMQGVRDVLQVMGHRITSTWIDNEGGSDGLGVEQLANPANTTRALEAAWQDIRDLQAAQLVINFTDGQPARGGRHVEFGLAYAWGLRLILVGPREHVFHATPMVECYPSWTALVREMATWCVDLRDIEPSER